GLELRPEMLDHGAHRHGGCIAESADGAAHDVFGHVVQQGHVGRTTVTPMNAVHQTPEPARAFTAGRALSAALVHVEVGQALQGFDHAARIVHDDHRARAQHGTGFGDGVVVHRTVH